MTITKSDISQANVPTQLLVTTTTRAAFILCVLYGRRGDTDQANETAVGLVEIPAVTFQCQDVCAGRKVQTGQMKV